MSQIKVFSGSQFGATSILNDNIEYSIGNYYECDVCLDDSIHEKFTCQFKVRDHFVVFSHVDDIGILLLPLLLDDVRLFSLFVVVCGGGGCM